MGARPFRGSAARLRGELTEHQLSHDYTRIYRDVYIARGAEIDAKVRALAAWEFAGPDAVLTGLSAAALHGAKWIDPSRPAELVKPCHFASPTGLVVRHYAIARDEILRRAGIRLTTEVRTAFDLGRLGNGDDAIVHLDALCNATGLKPLEIAALLDRHRGMRGVARLRRSLPLVDGGAESPPETRTRLALVRAGLSPPVTQVVVTDERGRFVARADMGWPKWRVLVEYQGEQHWTDRRQRAGDIERYARLEALGWRVVHVGAELLADRPAELVGRVRTMLRAAGYADGAVVG
jgi:hypothetical protein